MDITKTRRPSWITAAEAARRAEVTAACIADWVRRHGIGRKVGGRFRVDPEALDRLLAGELAQGAARDGGRNGRRGAPAGEAG